jgi:hypothetical protein
MKLPHSNHLEPLPHLPPADTKLLRAVALLTTGMYLALIILVKTIVFMVIYLSNITILQKQFVWWKEETMFQNFFQ